MKYRRLPKYKYQLTKDLQTQTRIRWKATLAGFIHLEISGKLIIYPGYAWDGASGPAIDTQTIMRGSLIHDALYQLIREGHLPKSYRKAADKELKRICLEDGMNKIRAWYIYLAVRGFGRFAV